MNRTAQRLREIAERIRLRCPQYHRVVCDDCQRDAADLERIAKAMPHDVHVAEELREA